MSRWFRTWDAGPNDVERARQMTRGLRLVGADSDDGLSSSLASDGELRGVELCRAGGLRSRQASKSNQFMSLEARRAVAKANLEAASDRSLDPRDPRWLVAVEAAAQLEGSVLTFERRRKVLAFAQRVGVRAFDANLIVAALQDRARRGEPIGDALPIVALTARPRGARGRWPYVALALVAVVVHVAAAAWIFR